PAPRPLSDEDGQLGDTGINQSARDRRECDPSAEATSRFAAPTPMGGKMSGIPAVAGGRQGLETSVAGVQAILIDPENLLGVLGPHPSNDRALGSGWRTEGHTSAL